LLDDLLGSLVRGFILADFERNRAHTRVPASAIAFAHFGKIDGRLALRPGIGSDGNFYAERTFTHSHAVNRIGMEVIGNELVVAFEIEIGNVEENGAVAFLRPLAQDVDGTAVTFEQRRQDGCDKGLFENL